MDAEALKKAVVGGRVRGYASVYNVVDDWETIFDPGVFSRWLAEEANRQVPIHWFHDGIGFLQAGAVPIGVTTMLREDSRGLYYEADIFGTRAGVDVLKAIAGDGVRHSSVTFRVPDHKRDVYRDKTGNTHFRSLDLVEISVLPYPGNRETSVEIFDTTALSQADPKPEPARGPRDPDVIGLFAQGLQRFTKEK